MNQFHPYFVTNFHDIYPYFVTNHTDLNFERQIISQLQQWKASGNRKPLIVRGARQVGKTTSIQFFAKSYKRHIFLNLEKSTDRRYFEEYDEVSTIKDALFLSHNISGISLKDTLLFIDEIQESPKAIQLLRYFYEEIPDLHVIAAGSLLEFAMHEVKSFPVGRVEFLYMHPLNFPEFLQATGQESALAQLWHVPVNPFAHHTLLDQFHQYAIIGGMPEVIKVFLGNKSMADLPPVYESIWATYQNDVEKYARNSTARYVIKHIVSTAHLYLDQRVKFQNFGNSNYRSREISEGFKNLAEAKVIQLIYPTTDTVPPIRPDTKKSPRMQFLDTGIIHHQLKIQADLLAMKNLSEAYKGRLIPHIIIQELLSLNSHSQHLPHFWVREKKGASAEVDLVMQSNGLVIPIEFKSGKTGTLKSLHQFIDQANHPYAVRMYAGNFTIEAHKTPEGTPYWLMNLPYYLGAVLPQYLDYFVQHYPKVSNNG